MSRMYIFFGVEIICNSGYRYYEHWKFFLVRNFRIMFHGVLYYFNIFL